jgi:hypothetical protein
MSLDTESRDLLLLINRICGYMGMMINAWDDPVSASLRRQLGDLRANAITYLTDNTFGTELFNCFVTARSLPSITYDRVAMVRQQIYNEQPTAMVATLVVETSILYCLTTESILISAATFKSRSDIEDLIVVMKTAFDAARDQAADRFDSLTYQNLTYLSGSLLNHLSYTALQLPRIVNFSYQASFPSLYLVNLIYQDASRSDELEDENKVVHPLFMPLNIIGLSA